MRKLVTVRVVDEINPIEGADRIELATIDGWQCVVGKGEFEVGNLAVYFEIDSALPAIDERFASIAARGKKKLNGEEVCRIKTIRLRGEISQGLLMPIHLFENEIERAIIDAGLQDPYGLYENEIPLEEYIGVVKYETAAATSRGNANAAGTFPWWGQKSDAVRVQNEFKRLKRQNPEKWYAATLKMDGSSTTVAYVTDDRFFMEKLEVDEDGGQTFVCSRNNTLKADMENRWWAGCQNVGLLEKAKKLHLDSGRNIAIQGELVGPGIQRNHENHDDYAVYAFSMWDIDAQRYLDYTEFNALAEAYDIQCVLMFDTFQLRDFDSVKDYLDFAEVVPSPFTDTPEGVVFHELHADEEGRPHHFKAISNRFLLS